MKKKLPLMAEFHLTDSDIWRHSGDKKTPFYSQMKMASGRKFSFTTCAVFVAPALAVCDIGARYSVGQAVRPSFRS